MFDLENGNHEIVEWKISIQVQHGRKKFLVDHNHKKEKYFITQYSIVVNHSCVTFKYEEE